MKIPAIEWQEETRNLGDKLTNHNIYVTHTDTFKIIFRVIFIDTAITHYSGKESHTWLSGGN